MSKFDATLQTQYEQTFKKNQALENTLQTLGKEARKALTSQGLWNQEFDGNEVVGIIAIFLATRTVLAQKELAVTSAIGWIGQFENDPTHGESCNKILEAINFMIAGETINESIEKKN